MCDTPANYQDFEPEPDTFDFHTTLPAVPAGKKVIVVTCMDYRIDAYSAFGLEKEQAYVLRNAGGRVQDALRSIIISQRILGATDIFVVHHTKCGMKDPRVQDKAMHDALIKAHPEHAELIRSFNFLPITDRTIQGSVRTDVEYLKRHPLVASGTSVTGYVYDVESGRVGTVWQRENV